MSILNDVQAPHGVQHNVEACRAGMHPPRPMVRNILTDILRQDVPLRLHWAGFAALIPLRFAQGAGVVCS